MALVLFLSTSGYVNIMDYGKRRIDSLEDTPTTLLSKLEEMITIDKKLNYLNSYFIF